MSIATHKPGSCDFIKELHELSKNKKTAVFPALFSVPPEVAMVVKALAFVGKKIEAIIYDDIIVEAKQVPEIKNKRFSDRFRYADIAELKQFQEQNPDTEIVILSNHFPHLEKIVTTALENAGINCHFYHFFDVPHSTEIDGRLCIINEIEYLRSWPAYLDKLNGKHMTEAEIERYKHGKYPYNNTSKGDYFCLENYRCLLTNIYNGYIECGPYTPAEGSEKTNLTIIGDSRMFSPTMPSRLNIPSLLQKRFMDEKINCEVKNFSTLSNTLQNELEQVKTLDLKKGDIVVIASMKISVMFPLRSIPMGYSSDEDNDEVILIKMLLMKEIKEYCAERGATALFLYIPMVQDMANMTDTEKFLADALFGRYAPNKSHRKLMRLCLAHGISVLDVSEELMNTPRESHFVDASHLSYDAQGIVTDALFEYVNDIILRDTPAYNDKAFVEEALDGHHRFTRNILRSHIDESEEYVNYLRSLSEGRSDNSGFILMNCNPFTLGHKYLVEEAHKQVDHLYIMVVPEENPYFTCKDRTEMARRAVAEYDNVEIIKSGTALANRALFPEYFEREKNPNAVVDLSNDIYTFCYQVAPALKVTKRFVGSEPNDPVTCQLNDQYKKALPDAGIELVELQRNEVNGKPVSASDVRRLLKEKKYDEVRALVPETTYNYLRNELGL